MKILGKIIIPILTFFSFLYVGLYNDNSHYEYLFCIPLFYFFISNLFLIPQINLKSSIFYIILNIVIFFRYVVLPFMIVYSGYYDGRSPVPPQTHTFNFAFYLIIYELIIVGIAASWLEKKYQRTQKISQPSKLEMKNGGNIIFLLFIFFIAIYLFVDRNWLLGVNFFHAKPIEVEIGGDILISSYLLLLAKQILFVLLVYKCSQKYRETNQTRYLFTSLLLLFLNIGIFIGTNRSDVLVPAIVSILLLSKLLPPKIIKYSMVLVIIGVSVLIIQITDTRQFASISNNESQLVDRTDLLQTYLGGPYNVAIAIETKEEFPEVSNPEVFFFDIIRPMIGVNFVVKDMDIKYSNIYFNKRLFKAERRSQILPMIGQGYIFFGGIFAPILSLLVIILAYFFMKVSMNYSNPLLFYFFTLCIARMAFFMGQNTMNMINDISFNLFLFLILFYLNKRFQT